MNRRLTKVIALMLIFAMSLSMTACSDIQDFFDFDHSSTRSHRSHRDKDRDDEDDEDEDDDEEIEDEDVEEADSEDEEASDDSSDSSSGISLSDKTPTPVPTPSASNVDIDLVFPDHVPTVAELHPEREPGDITGDEASELLNQLETIDLQRSIGNSYVNAEILFADPDGFGLSVDSVSWGEINADADEELEYISSTLDQLYSIDYESLDDQDRAFYDKFVYDLEVSQYIWSYSGFNYYTPIFDPLLGPQSELFFILDVLEFDSVEKAENYIEILRDLDRYFDEICVYEEERAAYGFASSDDVYEDMQECFENMLLEEDTCFLYESFENKVNSIEGISDDEAAALIEEHDDVMHSVVFPEFQECADRMGALVGSGGVKQGLCNYEGGDAYYTVLFMNYANSTKSIEETTTQLEASFDFYWETYTNIASTSTSWINEYLTHDYSMGDTQANLDYLVRAVEEDFPSLPSHDYFLRDVPESMEENFSPAAYLGYHLDNFDSNMIITNQANVDSEFGITCAHEGYPGHMFQSVYTRSVCEHPYLYLNDSIGYTEGWATYAENFSYQYFTEVNDASTIVQIDGLVNVLLMARFDIGINYEGWDADDCQAFCSEHLGSELSEESVDQIYTIVTNQPGYGVKYGIGFLNTGYTISQIRNEFPDASYQEIHTAYLNALPLTFEMIYDRMYDELSGN